MRRQTKLEKALSIHCSYCGDVATVKDHVIPRSVVGENTPLIPACYECNAALSNRVFKSALQKRNWIKRFLKRKYARLLSMPEWTNKEINQLEGKLKKKIIAYVNKRKFIRERIAYEGELELIYRNCLSCEKRVMSTRDWARFCNDECRNAFYRSEVEKPIHPSAESLGL